MLDWLTSPIAHAASGIAGFLGQQDTNAANQANAKAQMDFQERMSNSAYQRQVKDMESAGLNPMLAYVKGGGASSPPGSMATYQNPAAAGVSSALSSAQISQTQASTKQISAQTEYTKAQTDLTNAQYDQVLQTTEKIYKESRNLDTEQDRLKSVIVNLAESSALMAQQGETEVSKRKVLSATTLKLKADGAISQAEYDAMVRTNFIGVTAREVKVMSDVTSEWVDKFLPWRQGKSTTEEHTDIIRDSKGRPVGTSKYRTTK